MPTLSLLQSLFTTTSSIEKSPLPIVVYHIVRPSYPDDSPAVRSIALTPETFDAEMKYLSDAHYHVVSLRALENYIRYNKSLPKNPIVLTFDDGWSDQYQYAFPILQKYHYMATFFVFTNPIGTRGFMSWEELKTMLAAGMTIGSHTRSHPYLTHIENPTALSYEINSSKQVLESHLGVRVNEFAYPFGQYNADVMAMVKKAGYLSARGDYVKGTQTASNLYELNALNAPTTLAQFAQKFPPN